MKNTLKIVQILESIEEKQRKEIIMTFDECMKAICCEKIEWKGFEVYTTSQDVIKNMLISLSPEHIMAVSDIINQKDGEGCTVKIACKITNKEEEIFTVKQANDTFLVYIPITSKQNMLLEEKARNLNNG